MKFYRVEYSADSILDIKSIYDYIAYVNKEPQMAQKIAETIDKNINRLSTFPKRHPLINLFNDETKQLRVFPHKGYLIVYQIFEEESLVVVVRILDSKQDVSVNIH